MRPRLSDIAAALLASATLFAADRSELREQDFRWFSISIDVRELPASAEFATLSAQVNFSDWLRQLNVSGAVDERTLRLYAIRGSEREEIPVQFVPENQPTARRRTLPGVSANVSYMAEYPAGETPDPEVAGELAWVATRNSGTRGYLLRFAVRRTGSMIQVPYPPRNLRGSDPQGRGTPVRWFPQMRISPQWPFEGAVHIFQNQELITSYHPGPSLKEAKLGPSFRRPFFYPVNGPDGFPLTEFGKPHDPTGSHAHHYSLWVAHASVNGNDFWSEKGGVIAHDQFELMEDGPIFCRLIQKTRWINPGGTELLHEKRHMTFYKELDDFRLIDIELEFTPAGPEAVTFGKTSFGFLAVRVAQSMTVFDGAGEIRNSSGELNEQNAHWREARWIDQSGPVSADRWGGIAIFDHPQNLNHPTGWHCRNDGWAGASFNIENSFTLDPTRILTLKYRLLLHRHNAERGEVENRYQEFAAEPGITFGQPRPE